MAANLDGRTAHDVRLGDEFSNEFSDEARYCPDTESWLVWDGKRWATDATHRAEHLLIGLCRRRLAAAADLDGDSRDAEVKFWATAMHQHSLKGGLWAARSDPQVVVRLRDLDVKPHLLCATNGTLNLLTGKLGPHDPAHLITRMCPVAYDAGADRTEWDAFLSKMLPDPQVRAFAQRAAGYSISGTPREEVVFHVSGPTASGKSTFVSAVRSATGDYAATANFETFLQRRDTGGPRSDLVRLAGRRFVSSVETEEGAHLAGGLLKWISGQDVVTVRGLYCSEIEFLPSFVLWLVANHRPKAADDDEALWRRLLLIPFLHTLPASERNPDVKRRLSDPAIGGPAVLSWLVEGHLAWRRDGLIPPEHVTVATQQWRAENDPLADWLEERVTEAAAGVETFQALLNDYHWWAARLGIKRTISPKNFAARLGARGFIPGRTGRTNLRTYAGLILKHPQGPTKGEESSNAS